MILLLLQNKQTNCALCCGCLYIYMFIDIKKSLEREQHCIRVKAPTACCSTANKWSDKEVGQGKQLY